MKGGGGTHLEPHSGFRAHALESVRRAAPPAAPPPASTASGLAHMLSTSGAAQCWQSAVQANVGPWLGWGWEASVSRARHERTSQRTDVLTAATHWQGPGALIAPVQRALTDSTFYGVDTLSLMAMQAIARISLAPASATVAAPPPPPRPVVTTTTDTSTRVNRIGHVPHRRLRASVPGHPENRQFQDLRPVGRATLHRSSTATC